jgi:hypothetical protein
MSIAAEVGVVATAVLAVCAVVGLIVRFVLLPYLRAEVVEPVKETHRQVTPHHRPANAEPTIVDRLDDVQSELRAVAEVAEGLSKKVRANRDLIAAAGHSADAAHARLTEHEAWAREEDRRLWRAIEPPGSKPGGPQERKPQL